MTVTPTQNTGLEALSNSYQVKDTKEEDAYLGRDAFLTMLVAQLENQDPLNPMEGSDFSAQLAQFSQLEQLINLNGSMDSMKTSYEENSQSDVTSLVGKEITANVDSIEIVNGAFIGGDYNISELCEVMVTIFDSQGNEVRTLYEGQKSIGSHGINWDGNDNNGNKALDGSYKYSVMTNNGSGYAELPITVTGKVESIVYSGGKPYFQVKGLLVNPESLTQVKNTLKTEESSSSIVDYLGKDITTSAPLALVENGAVLGNEFVFELNEQQTVTVKIFDPAGNKIKEITIPAQDTKQGINKINWDGSDNSNNTVLDGIYSYSVTSNSENVKTSISDEVSGIKYLNGNQYLVLKNSGVLSDLSSLTNVN
ncbi:MAG: hypothetical protein B6I26_02230 [Desulfobacteraceae bacterium 4572_130]|nr:MAG: hypothetical protein B6I26_02230 [Desulfobacteraceae bacterium 4572_130]